MNWTKLLGASPGLRDVAQYPDVELYGAATMLRPDERPTVPVRMFDSNTDLKPWGYPEGKNNKWKKDLGAFVPKEKNEILVNREGYGYKDRQLLSGVLAHEQSHVAPDGHDEVKARLKEIDVLGRYGKKHKGFIADIRKKYRIK